MNFERHTEPHKTLNIGKREFAIHEVEKLAKYTNLTFAKEKEHPNNPEIVATWAGNKGSYIYLIEKLNKEYSISYDIGLFNYGDASLEEVTEMIKKHELQL